MQEIYQSLVAVNPVTLIAQICNLFITLFVFRKYYWNKVRDILDQRRSAADQEITDAQAARSEAMKLQADYEQNLRQSKAQADQLLLSARQNAALRAEEIIRDAQQTAAAIRQKSEAEIAREKKKALNDVKNEISELAVSIAVHVVGRELTAADRSRMADHFIDELDGSL